jgi:hypothetical protein
MVFQYMLAVDDLTNAITATIGTDALLINSDSSLQEWWKGKWIGQLGHSYVKGAYVFNQTHDQMTSGVSAAWNMYDSGSWSYWFKSVYPGNNYFWAIAKGNAAGSYWSGYINTKYAYFGWKDEATTANSVNGTTSVLDGNWHLISGSYQSSSADLWLYVDGVCVASNMSVTGPASNALPFVVGNDSAENSQTYEYFYVGPVGFWDNKTVSAAEWLSYYASYTEPAGATTLWKFEKDYGRTPNNFTNAMAYPGLSAYYGTANRPAWTNYGGNGCYLFDGVNDRTVVYWPSWGNAAQGVSDMWTGYNKSNFTVSCWFNPLATYAAAVYYLWGQSDTLTTHFALRCSGNTDADKSIILIGQGGLTYAETALNSWTDAERTNVWNHIVVSYDATQSVGSRTKIYLNGTNMTLIADTITTIPDFSTYGVWTIGCRGDFNWPVYGFVDDPRLYTIILDQTQVTTLFNAGRK